MNQNNLIVCFAGGSGGHLIASVCSSILYNTPINILTDGSAHSFKCTSYLSNLRLDNSLDSLIQEIADIQRLPEFDLAVAHYRNLNLLVGLNKKVIYISFEEDDLSSIASRLSVKMSDLVDQKTYNILKGTEWPSYDSIVDPANSLPDDVKEMRTQFLKSWYWVVPASKSNILEIKFKDLTSETTVVNIANFLNIKDYSKSYITEKLLEYRKKQAGN